MTQEIEQKGEMWQQNGHRIRRCDSSTGHTLRDVALCDDEATAKRLFEAIAHQLVD